jgi:hypothetical protein
MCSTQLHMYLGPRWRVSASEGCLQWQPYQSRANQWCLWSTWSWYDCQGWCKCKQFLRPHGHGDVGRLSEVLIGVQFRRRLSLVRYWWRPRGREKHRSVLWKWGWWWWRCSLTFTIYGSVYYATNKDVLHIEVTRKNKCKNKGQHNWMNYSSPYTPLTAWWRTDSKKGMRFSGLQSK